MTTWPAPDSESKWTSGKALRVGMRVLTRLCSSWLCVWGRRRSRKTGGEYLVRGEVSSSTAGPLSAAAEAGLAARFGHVPATPARNRFGVPRWIK